MTENKKASRVLTPQSAALSGTLAHVDVAISASSNLTDREKSLILYGELRAKYIASSLSDFLFLQTLDEIKQRKAYAEWGFASFEAFVETTLGKSKDTIDRRLKDLKENPGFLKLNELFHLSRKLYVIANPEFDGKDVIVGGERYEIKPANRDAIQIAFNRIAEKAREKADEASAAKRDLEKTRAECETLSKANKNLAAELRDAKNPPPFANATEFQRTMLNVQSRVDAALHILGKLKPIERGRYRAPDPENGDPKGNLPGLNPQEVADYKALCKYLYTKFANLVNEAYVTFHEPLDPPDRELALAVNNPDMAEIHPADLQFLPPEKGRRK